ncbi:MAG TPA: hypothetical protein VFS43_31580 [Polyangiaceae bacterium]|nr:hypothetical protein [Polyangiaceae bacterium]
MALDLTELLARARDHATPGADLERIAGALLAPERARARDPRDRAVLGALAGNPNAPPALLFALAQTYAAEVAANPALPLLLLENPSLLASAPVNGLCALLARPELPPDWFEPAARHPSPHVRRAVAGSRRAPAAALLRLAGDDADIVRTALAANPAAPGAALARLGRAAYTGQAPYARLLLRKLVAANPSAPLATLEALAAMSDVLPSVAGNLALPPALVEALASSEQADVRAAVAARPDLPPRLARRLAADPDPGVRAALARHAEDPDLLARLSFSLDGGVRRALLDNPNTPPVALERLSHAPVARHRTAARERLAKQGAAGDLPARKDGLSKALAPCPFVRPHVGPHDEASRPRTPGPRAAPRGLRPSGRPPRGPLRRPGRPPGGPSVNRGDNPRALASIGARVASHAGALARSLGRP